jgi:phosphoglycerate dehydrogenase-like enzyme
MHVLAWSRSERDAPGVERAELDELLRRADLVCVNVALTDETRGLIDDERLARMKPSAILVNTARGGIVDDEALRRRLEAGLLGGAVLDVLEREPPGKELERLARAPNVLITPHIAWHTDEALARQFEQTTDNVLEFLAGRPRNLVAGESLVA